MWHLIVSGSKCNNNMICSSVKKMLTVGGGEDKK